MKRILLPMMILTLLYAGSAVAQLDHKITTGVVSFQQGDYKKAMTALDEGLVDNASKLKDKSIPKGYYYRGMTRMKLFQDALVANAEKNPAEVSAADAQLIEKGPMDSYQDFKRAKETDDGKWGKKVDQQMQVLSQFFLQASLTALQSTFGSDFSNKEKKELYQTSLTYSDLAIELMPDQYLTYDIKAQAALGLQDSAAALKNFKMSQDKYAANPPNKPDLLVTYTYYRQALLERYFNDDLNAALSAIDNGKSVLDAEWKKIEDNKENYSAEDLAGQSKTYKAATEDLGNFELDILLNSPGMLDQAIKKFEKAIQESPNDFIKHVAYAQLLEKVDVDKAIPVYEKAQKIDPKNYIGWFNLGALYVNKAVEKYKAANDEEDMEKARALQTEGDDLFKIAYPMLQEAQRIEPCDREVLKALQNICINLSSGDEKFMADYKTYKAKEKECFQ